MKSCPFWFSQLFLKVDLGRSGDRIQIGIKYNKIYTMINLFMVKFGV